MASPSAALTAAMQELYSAVPEDFLAVRKQLATAAKEAGDLAVAREVAALRKPTLAAWSVNLLVRERPDLVERLAQVGQQMRTAQGALDMTRLQALRPPRDALISDLVAGCVELAAAADRRLSPALQDSLGATVVAALASQEATEAVASGTLTRTLSYSGFGEVDLHEAVARTSSGAILTLVDSGVDSAVGRSADEDADGHAAKGRDLRGDAKEVEAGADIDAADLHTADLHTAEARLVEAEAALARARSAVTVARDRGTELRSVIEDLENRLSTARAEDEQSLEELSDAVRARKRAESARTEAAGRVAALRRGAR